MKTYLFNTFTTMKEYNSNKYWIDSNIIPNIRIKAKNIKAALQEFKSIVDEKYCIEISNSALKNKSGMYRDNENDETIQTGYVITAKTLFDKGNYSGHCYQYINLWIEINQIVSIF